MIKMDKKKEAKKNIKYFGDLCDYLAYDKYNYAT